MIKTLNKILKSWNTLLCSIFFVFLPCVGRYSSAAMLAHKRLAGFALRNQLHAVYEKMEVTGVHPGFKTQGNNHQQPNIGYQ